MLLYHPLSSASKRPLRRAERLECRRNRARRFVGAHRKARPNGPEENRNVGTRPSRLSRGLLEAEALPALALDPKRHPKRRRTFALSLSRPLAPFHAWPRTPWPRTCPGTACTKRATPLPTVVKSHVFSVNTRRAFCRLFPATPRKAHPPLQTPAEFNVVRPSAPTYPPSDRLRAIFPVRRAGPCATPARTVSAPPLRAVAPASRPHSPATFPVTPLLLPFPENR